MVQSRQLFQHSAAARTEQSLERVRARLPVRRGPHHAAAVADALLRSEA